ncbi:hypothetical protein Tco_1090150 [Tanacetum coccineum]|uniref:Uncharacterized protein n=1 Tax=Tanacetum coccineum TaxID=301880 RepID=A0ABQ5I513_9ASTR
MQEHDQLPRDTFLFPFALYAQVFDFLAPIFFSILSHVVTFASPNTHPVTGPGPQHLTPGTLSLGLVPNPPSLTPYVPPTKKDWDILFQPMFDEYFNPPPSVDSPVPAVAALDPIDSTGSPSSTTIDQDAPSTSTSQTP